MNPAIHRVLAAYRPLYLNGLLKDGQYRLPGTDDAPTRKPTPARSRMLLVALASLRSFFLTCGDRS